MLKGQNSQDQKKTAREQDLLNITQLTGLGSVANFAKRQISQSQKKTLMNQT